MKYPPRGGTVVATPQSQQVPAQTVRCYIDKIVSSRFFVRSTRLSRFLRFTTEHALAGTSEQVKEYLVGVEVFDRKPD